MAACSRKDAVKHKTSINQDLRRHWLARPSSELVPGTACGEAIASQYGLGTPGVYDLTSLFPVQFQAGKVAIESTGQEKAQISDSSTAMDRQSSYR